MARFTIDDLPRSYGGKVTLRKKALANGGFTLYLDLYTKGKRKYEFLGLRLIPETSPADKRTNLDTLRTADVVARERSAQEDKKVAGFEDEANKERITLFDVMSDYEKSRKDEDGAITERSRRINDCSRHLAVHLGDSRYMTLCVSDVDKSFCEGFISYLKTAKGLRKNTSLCQQSQRGYLETFTSALNYAVRKEYIYSNPMSLIDTRDKIKVSKTHGREFLTIDEVKNLASKPCSNDMVKRAFMFSCFCGLRLSDILSLQWQHIERVGDSVFVSKTIQKTKDDLRLKLSTSATRWLPNRPEGGGKEDLVFQGLPHKAYISHFVENWVKKCGIEKHISFHCARHTFATMSLTLGADLYVVSKLMGHSNVEVTQIYAKIIDERKEKAMDLLDSVL